MEIREGIRYEYKPGKFAIVKQSLSNPKKFQGLFEEDNTMSSEYSPGEWTKDFKSGSLTLIEYPYKVGDWVYFLGTNKYYCSSFWTIGKIQQITEIYTDTLYFHGTASSNKINQFRPAFKEEIPKSKKKVVKENYDYLIPILIKLDE